jgi:RNA polymerase primary sigma factor
MNKRYINLNRNDILRLDELTKLYFKDIDKYPKLSNVEFNKLFQLYKNNGCYKSFHKILRSNLRFVVSAAKNYQNSGVSINDLINAGNVGLIEALSKFDDTRGVNFLTYAKFYITRELNTLHEQYTNHIKIPVEMKKQIIKSKKEVIDEFYTNNNVSKPIVVSISECIGNDDFDIESTIENPTDEFNSDFGYKFEMLHKCIDSLNDIEKTIITKSFGINESPLTYKEIGDILGISQAMVRIKREKALYKVSKIMVNN